MDRYEEAARIRCTEEGESYETVIETLTKDFRWYSEHYLQSLIDAAVKKALEKREKETCEWTPKIGTHEIKTSCGAYRNGRPMYGIFCSYCGRRIVEAEK